jgi:hypothetical protein
MIKVCEESNMAHIAGFLDGKSDASLTDLSKRDQYGIIKGLWPNLPLDYEAYDATAYDSFLQHVGREFEHLRHQLRHFAVQSLDGTFDVVRVLLENQNKSQGEIIQLLSVSYLNTAPAAIRRSVELTVRLWLTLNINSSSVAVGPTFPDETPLDWSPDVSLNALVLSQFPKSGVGTARTAKSRIDPAMTATYLASTCGLRLRWTDSLSEHLQFDATRQILAVYRHKICLVNHIETNGDCPIPEALLNEMLDTLNLLFPFGDVATKQLLTKEHQQSLYQLGSCGRTRKLDLADYEYFREELQYLIDSFNQPHKTWRQLATDRRNKMEWAIFWVTVMVRPPIAFPRS